MVGITLDLGAADSDEAIEFESLCVSLPTSLTKNAKTAKPPWEEPALGKSLGRCQWPWCLCILQVLYVKIWCDKCAPMGEKNSSQYPRSVAKTLWKSEGSLFLQGSDLAKLGLDPLSMLSGVSQCRRATPPHPGRISKCFNMTCRTFKIDACTTLNLRSPKGTSRSIELRLIVQMSLYIIVYKTPCSEVKSNGIVNEAVQLCGVCFYCHFLSLQYLVRNMSISSFPAFLFFSFLCICFLSSYRLPQIQKEPYSWNYGRWIYNLINGILKSVRHETNA